jgi:transcription initiation factor TFIIB
VFVYRSGQTNAFERNICGFCAGELLWDQENGESVCTSCGAVSTGPSEVFAELTHTLGAAGSSGSSHETSSFAQAIGVSTVIGGRDVDGRGHRIGQDRGLRQLRRLDTMVSWDSKKRRLAKVSMEVRRVTQSMGLNSLVAERAFEIYIKQFDGRSMKAKSLAGVAAASVCVACRELDIARPTNEIVASMAGVNKRQLRHYYRALLRDESTRVVPAPVNYVSMIAAKASLQGTTERRAIEILAQVKGDPRLVGKRPISIAAAALYLASAKAGERTTQLRLAYAANVTPITIRKRSLEISEILEAK